MWVVFTRSLTQRAEVKRCKVRVIAVKWEDNPNDYLIEVSQSEPVSGWECNDLKHFNIDRFKEEGDIKGLHCQFATI